LQGKENNQVKTIEEVQQEIIEEFSIFDNWMDRYNYIIDISKDLPLIDDKYKTKENLINGCQSKVWLHAHYNNGKMQYEADSDAIITKGIISLLIRVLSNRKPDEIMNSDLYFIDQIGLKENLSPTRSNGLLAMVKQMKLYAIAYNAREKQASN
jgi:cysteine desulfuration protein SufE